MEITLRGKCASVGCRRWPFFAIVAICGAAILFLGLPRFAGSLLRTSGNQAAELAVAGQSLRVESYGRAVASRERAAAWYQDRRSLVELAFIHFNLGNQASRGTPKQAAFYERSLQALHESLELSPAQPIAWLMVAGIHYERGARQEAARALEWTVRSGPYLVLHHRTRTIVGLAVWDLVDAPTQMRLMDSIRHTLKSEADLVARSALAAAMEDTLAACLRLLQPDGAELADRFGLAVEIQRQIRPIEPPPRHHYAPCQPAGEGHA